jgi:hypothetical protein
VSCEFDDVVGEQAKQESAEMRVEGSVGGGYKSRLLRAWATVGLSEDPEVLAEDARKQAELWVATGRGE